MRIKTRDSVPFLLVALLVLCGSVQAALGVPLFVQPFPSYPAGAHTWAVPIADLNGDSNPDIVAVNAETNTLSVLLGRGDGTFTPKVDFPTGSQPIDAAISDLNGDEIPDVLVANRANKSVSVFVGNGDGSFRPRIDYESGYSTWGVAIADVNGDSRPDIFAANTESNSISVLLSNGQGALQRQVEYAVGAAPYSVAVGDFNSDGHPDLVSANGNDNSISVLLGNGLGVFGPKRDFPTGSTPVTVRIEDLNADQHLDVAVANNGSNNISILLGHGDGTFGDPVNFETGRAPWRFVCVDLNHDQRFDLAVANNGGDDYGQVIESVSILIGNGDGSFQPRFVARTDIGPINISAADLNHDSHLDLVTANFTQGTVSVLLGYGDGTFVSDVPTGSGPRGVAIGDINGDAKPDLIAANTAANTLSLITGTGDGTFRGRLDVAAGPAPSAVLVADLNGDSRADLVVTNRDANSISIFLATPTYRYETPTSLSTGVGPAAAAAGDLNADGRSDLAVANTISGSVSVFLARGDGTFDTRRDVNIGTSPTSMVLADVNGDRQLDVLVAHPSAVTALLGDGMGGFAPAIETLVSGDPTSLVAADVNGDTLIDLVIGILNANQVVALIGEGDGRFTIGEVLGTPSQPTAVALVDFNRDSRPDLAVSNSPPNRISVLLGNGAGGFTPSVDLATGEGPAFLAIADVNLDTAPDLVCVNQDASTATVLLNGDLRATLSVSPNPVPMAQDVVVHLVGVGALPPSHATLYYQPRHGISPLSLGMTQTAGGFEATIPGSFVTEAVGEIECYARFERGDLVSFAPPGAPAHDSLLVLSLQRARARGITRGTPLSHQDVRIDVPLSAGTVFVNGALSFRPTGSSGANSWRTVELVPDADFAAIPSAVIPADAVTERGLEYWFWVKSLRDTVVVPESWPNAPPLQVRTQVEGMQEPFEHARKTYRILSFPLDFGPDPHIEAILQQDPAFALPYDKTRWRLFRFEPREGRNIEFAPSDSLFRPRPGRAFWLTSAIPHRITTGPIPGLSTTGGSGQHIALQPGWNPIGDPYAFPVAWDSSTVRIEPPVIRGGIRQYDGTPGWPVADRLVPFEGYFVYADAAATLTIQPIAIGTDTPRKASRRDQRSVDTRDSWSIQLAVEAAGRMQSVVEIGVDPTASDDRDSLDQPRPPAAPETAVTIEVAPNPNDPIGVAYDHDYRSPGPGHRWDVQVQSKEGAVIRLVGLRNHLPEGYVGRLVDHESQSVWDLPCSEDPIIQSFSGQRPYRLALFVGAPEFVFEESRGLVAVPLRLVLESNVPNPFNPSTRIRFGLPQSAWVTLEVFDVRGQRVTQLIVGQKLAAGFHTAIWAGRDATGSRVASGVYLYRLSVPGEQSLVKKMIVMK